MQRPSQPLLCWKRPKRHHSQPSLSHHVPTINTINFATQPTWPWRKEDTAGLALADSINASRTVTCRPGIEGIAMLPRELPKQVALWREDSFSPTYRKNFIQRALNVSSNLRPIIPLAHKAHSKLPLPSHYQNLHCYLSTENLPQRGI